MADFVATPTMQSFMLSTSYVRVLAGPIGAGKSVCCAHELMRMAMTQQPNKDNVRKTRFLVVRNTVDQLRSTTFKTIVDWFPPTVFGNYRATEKTLFYKLRLADGSVVESEWMLVALDHPDDVRKALSLEATALWGNECRELHPEVVDGLLMRVNRYPSKKDGGATRAGAIFDTNMPGEESWWEERMSSPPANWSVHIQPPAVLPLDEWIETYGEDPDETLVATGGDGAQYAIDPEADNLANLADDYYQQTLQGKSEDFINVYLRCQYGRTLSGLPVYDKTFKPQVHIAQGPLTAIRSEKYPLCVGLDFGRQPAAVIGQLTPGGQVMILSEVIGENMGIQTFVQTLLKPHLVERYPGVAYFIAGDPAGWQKTQLGEMSPADYIKQAGMKIVKAATNKIKPRIEAVETLLMASADAKPRLQIDPACATLIRGFRGGYKWAVNKRGDVTNESEPMKNPSSHVSDAMQYLALMVDGGYNGALGARRREVQGVTAVGWT